MALGLPEDANWDHFYKKFGNEYDYNRYKIDEDLLMFVSDGWYGSDAVGMEIGNTLNDGDVTVPECKEKLRKLLKEKFDVDVELKHIFWDYGEWGNG
jgi:hypothetical protein